MQEKLKTLLQEDKFDEMRTLVQEEKRAKGLSVLYDEAIINVMCDAILQNKPKAIQIFLEEGVYVNERANISDDPKITLLCFATQKADLPVVKVLVEGGANANIVGASGNSPLHNAVIRDDLDLAEYLLENSAAVDIANDNLQTPLHLAATSSPKMTRLLIMAGANKNVFDSQGLTPLGYSEELCLGHEVGTKQPHHDAQQELRNAGAVIKNKKDVLLIESIKHGDAKEVERLISDGGADVNLNYGEGTPLCIAAEKCYDKEVEHKPSEKRIKIIEILLGAGADANNYTNKSPLYLAARAGSAKAVALLLPVTEKRSIDKKDVWTGDVIGQLPWYVPLMFNSYRSNEWLPILRLLKEHGANFNEKYDHVNDTLLDRALRLFPSSTEISRIMFRAIDSFRGCEDRLAFLALQGDEQRLIQMARESSKESLDTLNFLLDSGADPSVVSGDDQYTVLHTLIADINLDYIPGVIRQLIERFTSLGLNVDTPDIHGNTPLHCAARTNDVEAAQCLLDEGANVHAINGSHQTPLDISHAAGMKEVSFILMKATEQKRSATSGQSQGHNRIKKRPSECSSATDALAESRSQNPSGRGNPR